MVSWCLFIRLLECLHAFACGLWLVLFGDLRDILNLPKAKPTSSKSNIDPAHKI